MPRRPREPTRTRKARRVWKVCEGPYARTTSGRNFVSPKVRNVSKTRVAMLKVGPLTGRSCELAEALERRRIDFCAVQEKMWSCSKSGDIGQGYKTVVKVPGPPAVLE
ncbi:unnamed protein product [Heligmosomoides polygyrus]|uniref:50S ribosomal protein L32 n=1 Tax=Heligmosomoides polygyrus TaxID=6339 RepID=A0A183GHX3_HELPZ|nr:unnamed protein product [Heligmosomoides polygyrus]